MLCSLKNNHTTKSSLVQMFSTKSTSKTNVVLNVLYSLFFYLTLVSIPVCSFNSKFLYITWACTGLLALTMFVKIIANERLSYNRTIVISLFLLVVAMLFSSLLNLNGAFTFTPFILIAVMIGLNIFFTTFPETRVPSIGIVALSVLTFLGIFVFLYRKELIARDFYRLGDLFGDQNEIAMFLSLGAIFCVYCILFSRKPLVIIISLLFLAVFVYCGFSTGSKLFLLTLLGCSIFLIFTFFGKKWWISLIAILGLIGIGVLLINLPVFARYKDRILNFFNFFAPSGSSNDFSTYDRFQMFLGGFHMFGTKPIFGFGTLGFAQLSSFQKGAHNTLVQLLTNYGIVGLVIFTFPFIYVIKKYIKKKEERNLSSAISLTLVIFFLLCSLSLYLDLQKNYAFIIPLVFAEILDGDKNNKTISLRDLGEKKPVKNRKIKICFVISNLDIGGPQELVTNMIRNIDRETFEISVVAMFDKVCAKYDNFIFDNPDINFYVLNKKKGLFSLLFIHQLKMLLRDINPDIYSTHTSTLPYVSLATSFSTKPIIHTIHSLPEYDQRKLQRFIVKSKIRNHRIILVGVSKTITEMAAKLYKVDVINITNGVNLPTKINNKEKQYDFITIGRLVKMKRIDAILDVFASINKEEKYSLAVLGEGEEKENLINKVKENNIKNVTFLGSVEDVSSIIEKARIHLMASTYEACPLSILETMSYGVPSIAPEVGGIPDIIIDQQNGLLFDVGNTNEIETLIHLLLEKKTYDKMNKSCLLEVKKYDIKLTTQSYEELFKKEVSYEK